MTAVSQQNSIQIKHYNIIFTITYQKQKSTTKQKPIMKLNVLLTNQHNLNNKWSLPEVLLNENNSEVKSEEQVKDTLPYKNACVMLDNSFQLNKNNFINTYMVIANQKEVLSNLSENETLVPMDEWKDTDMSHLQIQMIDECFESLKTSIHQSTIVKSFLPKEFSLGELVEIIKTIDPSFENKEDNFIRKITKTKKRSILLEEAKDSKGVLKTGNAFSQRPAQLYKFTGKLPDQSIFY